MNNKPNNVVATLKFHRFVYRGYACRGCAACILRKKKKRPKRLSVTKAARVITNCMVICKQKFSQAYTAESGIDVVQGINEQVGGRL